MAERIPQSVAYLVVFRAYLASDGKTPATGKTIAITISKNGATSFSNPGAGATNATEMASGFYKFTLASGDTDTLGPLAWRGANADINDAGDVLTVAAATNAGFSALPNAAAEAAGGLYTRGTGAGQINQSANGQIDVNAERLNNVAQSLLDLKDFADAGYDPATDKVQGVVLVDATTSVTNRVTANTDQIEGGDATNQIRDSILTDATRFAGASIDAAISSRAPSATALSTAQWTNTRAGYLDNLNVGGLVASSAEVTSVQNNTRVVRVVPDVIERPDSGTTTYRIELLLYDSVGNMEAPDAAPTIALVNQAGTDRSSRLDSTTMANVSTGRYRAIYTADGGDTLEQLVWTFSVVEGGATRLYGNTSLIVDTSAVDFTSADRTKLEAVFNKLPSKNFLTGTANSDGDVQMDEATGNFPGSVGSINGVTFPTNFSTLGINASGHVSRVTLVDTITTYTGNTPQTGDAFARLGAPAGVSVSADITSVKSDTTSLLGRLGAFAGSGLNTVLGFLRALLRKDAALTPSDVGGDYDNTTDSLQAIKDNQLDAAISTRAPATTAVSSADYTAARAAKLDNLDVAVSTRGTGDATAASQSAIAAAVALLQESQYVRRGTAQGGSVNTLQLDAGASSVDDFYKYSLLVLVGGQGAGQARFISGYTGSNQQASVSPNWNATPNGTTVFQVVPFGQVPGATAPTADEVADAVLATEVESGVSLLVAQRRQLAATTGKSSGAALLSEGETATVVFKDPSGTKDRISAVCTHEGNRTDVTYDDS